MGPGVTFRKGYGWAPNLGQGPLCYFDTRDMKGVNVGKARGTMTLFDFVDMRPGGPGAVHDLTGLRARLR